MKKNMIIILYLNIFIYIFSFDLSSDLELLNLNGKVKSMTTNYFMYVEKEKESEEFEFKHRSKIILKFNNCGFITEKSFIYYHINNYYDMPKYLFSYSYNESGQLIEQNIYDISTTEKEFFFKYKIKYFYNDKNKLIHEKYEGIYDSEIYYQYDENNKLVSKKSNLFLLGSGKKVDFKEFNYIYDINGNLIDEKGFDDFGTFRIYSYQKKYSYYDNNNIKDIVIIAKEGLNTYKNTYKYDINKNLIEIGEFLNNKYVLKNFYNNNKLTKSILKELGNLIVKNIFYKYSNETELLIEKEIQDQFKNKLDIVIIEYDIQKNNLKEYNDPQKNSGILKYYKDFIYEYY